MSARGSAIFCKETQAAVLPRVAMDPPALSKVEMQTMPTKETRADAVKEQNRMGFETLAAWLAS